MPSISSQPPGCPDDDASIQGHIDLLTTVTQPQRLPRDSGENQILVAFQIGRRLRVPLGHDYYPAELRAEIDEINAVVYANVNNGVYRCGFAGTQEAYEAAAKRLFETLDLLEERLSRTRYLAGDTLTEADWRLFTTLVRFDAVYHGHFKQPATQDFVPFDIVSDYYPFRRSTIACPRSRVRFLMYHYRRLDEVRAAASKEGFRGAMFP